MNNRLTIQELAVILAEKTGKDRKAAEGFLREFIHVVTENVYTDKLVKVKGLGSFKIIPVGQRESIHVNTGRRIVIPAHYKFSFHPDKELRELVNLPFSFFETTELNPGVEFVMQEEEPVADEVTEPETADVPEAEPATAAQPLPADTTHEEKTITKEEVPPAPVIAPAGKEDKLPAGSLQESNPQALPAASKGSLWPLILTIVATVLVTAGGLYLYFEYQDTKNSLRGKTETIKNTISPVETSTRQEETSSREAVVLTDSTAVANEAATPPEEPLQAYTPEPPAARPDTTPPIATVKIEPGSRLTLIALEHYGHKLFWVYIYEYNKDIIDDPNNIPVGTVLNLPAKSLYDMDARSRKSLEKAAIRQTEILTGF